MTSCWSAEDTSAAVAPAQAPTSTPRWATSGGPTRRSSSPTPTGATPAPGSTWNPRCGPIWPVTTGGGGSTFYVDARLELAHRRILATARGGDDPTPALLDLLTDLLAQVGRRADAGHGRTGWAARPGRRRDGPRGHPRPAPRVRPAARLAELVGLSPYRLSRAFTREMGVSLTHYRNRVRLGAAMDRIEQGEESLAVLAADLGFADQAHLCRTARAHLPHPKRAAAPAAAVNVALPDRARSSALTYSPPISLPNRDRPCRRCAATARSW